MFFGILVLIIATVVQLQCETDLAELDISRGLKRIILHNKELSTESQLYKNVRTNKNVKRRLNNVLRKNNYRRHLDYADYTQDGSNQQQFEEKSEEINDYINQSNDNTVEHNILRDANKRYSAGEENENQAVNLHYDFYNYNKNENNDDIEVNNNYDIGKDENDNKEQTAVDIKSQIYDLTAEKMDNRDTEVDDRVVDELDVQKIVDNGIATVTPAYKKNVYDFKHMNLLPNIITGNGPENAKVAVNPNHLDRKRYLRKDTKPLVNDQQMPDFLIGRKMLSPKFLKMEAVNDTMKFSLLGKQGTREIRKDEDIVFKKDLLNHHVVESPQVMNKMGHFIRQLDRVNDKRQTGPSRLIDIRPKSKPVYYVPARPVQDIRSAFMASVDFFDLAKGGMWSLNNNRRPYADETRRTLDRRRYRDYRGK